MKRFWNLLTLPTRPKPEVGTTPADVFWQENKWRILRYRPRPEGVSHQTPLLMIPSLINRHYVLDLMPGKSFAEYMVAQGFDVYCIDWGTPGDEDRYVSFDDIVDGAIGRAIRKVSDTVAHKKAHVLGYCMGGTLMAIHGAVHPERIQSFVALAAPVKFNDGSLLSRWTNQKGFDLDTLVQATGNVPWQLLQGAFQMLRPTLPLMKAVNLLDRAWNDEFLDGFLALETWGNDNVSLPGEFYRTYIRDLYQRDCLLDGTFSLKGQRVNLKNLTCPTLAVTFEHDNIVPGPSAAALIEACGATEKQHLHLPGGHVGAVVSKHAAKTLWPQLVAFYEKFDAAPVKVVAPPVVNVETELAAAQAWKPAAPPSTPRPSPGRSRRRGRSGAPVPAPR